MTEVLSNFKTKNPSNEDWNRFVKDGLTWSDDQPTNVKYDFTKMCKLFGVSYLYWLEIQFKLVDEKMSLKEVCDLNGNVPISFFERFK